jgi:short-subunit dehydrogenase
MGQVSAVITGSSSGVGRATAHAFARRDASLVLVARSAGPLDDVVRECHSLGGEALAVPADVADPAALRHAAAVAVERYGGLDVWVNNAGVGVVGGFHKVAIEAHRRTIETNLLGSLHGAHAALPHFIDQGVGVLIDNVSIGGFVATPYAASYAASKFGVRAFSNSLRQELKDWPKIHVCAVYPFFMDTPGVQHGANYTRRLLQPAPPLYAPETTAEVIARLVTHPRRQVGAVAKLAKLEYQLAPRLVEWGLARFIEAYLRQADPAPDTDRNLFAAMPQRAGVHGGMRWSWPRGWSGTALTLGATAGLVALSWAATREAPRH